MTLNLNEIDAEIGRVNLNAISYPDSQNRTQRMFQMTRTGFNLIALGFTGSRALLFKLGYIKAFDDMEIHKRTGKKHKHVMRDIRSMLEEPGGGSKFGSSYRNSQNKEQPCFNLPKRECLVLISGYAAGSASWRRRVSNSAVRGFGLFTRATADHRRERQISDRLGSMPFSVIR